MKNEANDLGIAERVRRSEGRASRDHMANARVTKAERAELAAAAKSEGKALSEWSREVLLREARRGCTDTAIFTELMAFRLFANGVLKAIALGRTLTEKDFAALMTEVRENKHLAVAQTLAQYQPTTRGAE